MKTATAKSLVRVALLANGNVLTAGNPVAYEFETYTAYRVLVRWPDGLEVDVDYDKCTRCFRLFYDGLELGDPALN